MSGGWIIFIVILGAPILGFIWTLRDADQRGMAAPAWAGAVFLLLPIVLPVYLAVRALKPGETREGGRGWNILKNFALLWTLVVLVFDVALLMPVFSVAISPANRSSLILANILFAVTIWVGPMLVALIVGAFVRKPGLVEQGA